MAKQNFKLINRPKVKRCKHCCKPIEYCDINCEDCGGHRFLAGVYSLQ